MSKFDSQLEVVDFVDKCPEWLESENQLLNRITELETSNRDLAARYSAESSKWHEEREAMAKRIVVLEKENAHLRDNLGLSAMLRNQQTADRILDGARRESIAMRAKVKELEEEIVEMRERSARGEDIRSATVEMAIGETVARRFDPGHMWKVHRDGYGLREAESVDEAFDLLVKVAQS